MSDTEIADRLISAEFAYKMWEGEAREFIHAVAGSSEAGFIDGLHLSRSVELVRAIEGELLGLDEAAPMVTDPATEAKIDQLRVKLTILLDAVKQASLTLHAMTH